MCNRRHCISLSAFLLKKSVAVAIMRGELLLILCAVALGNGRKVDESSVINSCRKDSTTETFLPHEDCGQFYQCLNGIQISHCCPDGLHFDVTHGICNWPEIAKCQIEPDSNEEVNPETFDKSEPSLAPLICAMSNVNGVLVAHESCNKFYKCFNGKPVVMTCPLNLLYSTFNKHCDWPKNVKCGNRVQVEDNDQNGNGSDVAETTENDSDIDTDSADGGYVDPSQAPTICAAKDSEGVLVAHKNCNQFYKCSQGFPISLKCPLNLLYSPSKEYCDWPKNVDCGDRIIPEDGNDNVSSPRKQKRRFVKYSYNGVTNVHSDPSKATLICAAKDSDGVLVAHENCTQFYKCSQGLPVALNCPVNLFYNPYGEYCDWAVNVDCDGRLLPENITNDNENDGNEIVDESETVNENETAGCNQSNENANPSEAPKICAAVGSDGVLVAHEYCNHFYKCFKGRPVGLICPDNLLYNPSKKYCDWPHEVVCGSRIIPENGGDNNESNGNDTAGGSEGNNVHEGNSNLNEAVAICAAESSEGVLVAHEYCNQFYKCSKGHPVTLICPGNLLYNPEQNYCDWPQNVDCKNRTISESDSNNNNNENDDEGDDNDQNGNEGHSDPSLAPKICAKVGSDSVLVAHQICNKFFKCSEGIPVALDCPGNLLYNPEQEYCDWPQNVDCGNRSLGDEEENKNDDNSTDATLVNHCAGKQDGILVPHENCDQFYKCAAGFPVAITCPTGLLYNPSIEVCDWPSNVVCGDRIRRAQTQRRYLEAKKALRFLLRVY